MAPDRVGEVRHGMSPVADICRERGVGTSDVESGPSFQAGERRPFLCHCRRDCKLGGLAAPACSRDGQGIDFGVCGVSGNPERSVSSVDFPQEAGTAGHCFTDVDAGRRPGCECADHRDLVSGRFRDPLPGLFDGD